ncbi:hypothetical protein OOK36_52145 [Streptomyces sp. NBC_00365]|uniref:hypothetical protein n=1 Tax=Streptomyces sp. NBC_00365 TaxID=2975726 RepID=UPI002255CB18|nr:hypothetical protein [Streptomyces sp. NBC_00365]MCX5097097.1 hypothetical protein [Streptomyces sp. NBC_00365]
MTSQPAATLRSRYVEQAVSDLERNRHRQLQLAEQLRMLKEEEALLQEILTLAERYEGLSEPPRLPEQAQEGPVPQRVRRVSGAASARRATRTTSDTAKSGAKGKSRRPLLGDMLLALLAGHDEPRLAKEVRKELLQKHPDRTPTPQVVRNTLESLVAKGRVERHRQHHSVTYTLAKAPADQPQ